MFVVLALFSLFPTYLVAAEECTFVDDVKYSREDNFQFNQMEGDPARTYITTNRNIHSSDDCSYFSADFGFIGRICYACGDPESRREYMGALITRAASETEFGRELVFARADLIEIELLDADGNRVDEPRFDYTFFDPLECTCDGEPVDDEKGACPSGIVCSTTGATAYGSVSATLSTTITGNVASMNVNVSIVHTTLEGTPVITVGVPPRFKTYKEEDGSFVLAKDEVRIVFDSMCGANALTVESLAPEPPRDVDNQFFTIPAHSNVTFHMDATNATCDWSYAIEIELEETSAGMQVVATSWLLVALVASFFA